MKKALAQNPNLLRTLIGLSLTLIFMLSYAVYGATVSPSVYIYKTEPTVSEYNASEADEEVIRTYNEEENTTTWAWQVIANDANLTWVNITATELSDGSVLRVTNVAKLYSHELLGTTYSLENPLEEEFSCADLCDYASTHERLSEEGGTLEFYALTSVDPLVAPTGPSLRAILQKPKSRPGRPSPTPTHHRFCASKSSNKGTVQQSRASQPKPSTKNFPALPCFPLMPRQNSFGHLLPWLAAFQWS